MCMGAHYATASDASLAEPAYASCDTSKSLADRHKEVMKVCA
jgi:hypothetical protein